MKSHIRRNMILQAAFNLSLRPAGWIDLTRAEVAEAADCADGLINKYFSTMEKLKDAVMEKAVTDNNRHIIEQGLIYNNKIAKRAAIK